MISFALLSGPVRQPRLPILRPLGGPFSVVVVLRPRALPGERRRSALVPRRPLRNRPPHLLAHRAAPRKQGHRHRRVRRQEGHGRFRQQPQALIRRGILGEGRGRRPRQQAVQAQEVPKGGRTKEVKREIVLFRFRCFPAFYRAVVSTQLLWSPCNQ